MASSSPANPSGFPEYAVRRETISGYFSPPLPRSTFHDLVNKGKIIPIKGLRGFYKLNDSLKRLGLREVASPPVEVRKRTMEDILRLAFSLIDPLLFPIPPWVLSVQALDATDADHAVLQAKVHKERVDGLGSAEEKQNYLNGILVAQEQLETDCDQKC